MDKTTEQRLAMLEASVLTLAQSLQALTAAIADQARALDGLAVAIEQEVASRSEDEEEGRPQFLGQRG